MARTVLICSDFSAQSEIVEAFAAPLAQSMGARVILLHAVEPIDDSEADPSVEAFLSGLERKATRAGERASKRFQSHGLDVDLVVTREAPWSAILRVAEERGVDLIVAGRRELGKDSFVGTTSHRLFFTSKIPLLVVPTPRGAGFAI